MAFTAAFLDRVDADLRQNSINREALLEIRALRHTLTPSEAGDRVAREERRMVWALFASLAAFTGISKEPYEYTPCAVDLGVFCKEVPKLLAPYVRRLTVDVAEADVLDFRGAQRIERADAARELKQIGRIEQLVLCAQARNLFGAGTVFYDFIYRHCANVELLPAWARRLTEIP